MEERIIDREEGRGIRLTTTPEGETDAVDALTPETEGEESEAEAILTLPEGDEYDEDLVGLTPSQLKEELARRERAKKEAMEMSAKLTEEGEALLAEGDFAGAEGCFAQAIVYGYADERATEGLWNARTHGFTEIEPLLTPEASEELEENEEARELVVARLGEALRAEREKAEGEEKELAPVFEAKQKERREAFAANKAYYLLRFGISFGALVVFLVACAVSASFILRTMSIAPVVLTAVFGGLAFVSLAVTVVFTRGLVVASRLCRKNEKLSSTEEGARLQGLREKLSALSRILGEKE